MFEKLFGYLLGTYKVSFESEDVENVLTKIFKSGIAINKIKRISETSVCFFCYKNSINRIISIFVVCGITSYNTSRVGIVTHLRGYKKRVGIPIGVVIFFTSMFFVSSFIWKIEISGCESKKESDVIRNLYDCGFYIGIKKSSYDVSKVENIFLSNNRDFSWISINVKGTTAYIELRENDRKVRELNTSYPSNIYASRDGIIASVDAYMGYSVVKKGDTVTAGDLIISGEYTDRYGVEYKLHSYARVMAYTTRSYNVTVPYECKEYVSKGNLKKFYKIKTRRFSIPLYFNKKISYNTYNRTVTKDYLKLFDCFSLPLWIEKTTYYDVEAVSYRRTKEEALNIAYEKLNDFEFNLIGVTVVDRVYDIKETDDGITVSVFLDCYEDIGVEKQIN